MENLPPLPLKNGCLFIDHSHFCEGMMSCKRKLEYLFLHNRISAGEKPALNFGSAIHSALEYRYKTYKSDPPDIVLRDDLAQRLTSWFSEHPQPVDDFRTLNWANELMYRYNEKYSIEPFSLLVDKDGKVMVELSFAIPLYTYRAKEPVEGVPDEIPVIYTGRIDLPISWDNSIWIMDHKTTSRLGSTYWDQSRMSSQGKGYVWAWNELTGRPAKGYVINAIRVLEPPKKLTEPKNGKLNQGDVQKWWDESLCRERYQVSPAELLEWKNNTIDLVEEFFWRYQKGFFNQSTTYCTQWGRCPYFDVCTLPESDRGIMLQSGLFETNVWSPLKEQTKETKE